MARHKKRRHLRGHKHRRHHRRFRGIADVFDLNKETKIESIAVGAGAGLATTAAIKLLLSAVPSIQMATPDIIANNATLLGSALAGGGLYLFGHKSNPTAARGHLFGALFAGVSAWLWQMLQSNAPATFGDVVSVDLGNGARAKQLKGVIVKNTSGFQGLLIANASPGFPPRQGYSGLLAPNATNSGVTQDFSRFAEPDGDPMDEMYAT